MDTKTAVRELRKALGDTQQQFATRLGMAISTVVRYELTRPPKGKVLNQLAHLAITNGRPEIAHVFFEALDDEMGVERPEGRGDFLRFLQNAELNELERELLIGLKLICAHLEATETFIQEGDSIKAIQNIREAYADSSRLFRLLEQSVPSDENDEVKRK